MKLLSLFVLLMMFCTGKTMAQSTPATTREPFLFGDLLPTAPELAPRSAFGVGVTTLNFIHAGQINVENPGTAYDRPLTVEVWYPAVIPQGAEQRTTYPATIGRSDQPGSLIELEFPGRALRDAEPDRTSAPYPLLIVSHGYPGSRFMFTYLTENLASKGYIVAAIEHTDSTFQNVGDFRSTLLNRALDDRFVIDSFAQLNSSGDPRFGGLLDANNTGLIGYSMGGYGALNVIGAGYNAVVGAFVGSPLDPLREGADGYAADSRVKAAVLFAPWGGDLSPLGMTGRAMWDEPALANIRIPTLWIAGSDDDVSMYAGIARLFNWSIHSDRWLLTYENALHNVAPNPPLPQAQTLQQYEQLGEPVWNQAHMNNVNQHFLTAFFGAMLKGDESMLRYLNVGEGPTVIATPSAQGEYAQFQTQWLGFAPRTDLGLQMRHESPAP